MIKEKYYFMESKKILAIDLGTQSVRAAIVTPLGKIISVKQIQQEVRNPHPGWAEQKPSNWWNLVQTAVKDLLAENKGKINEIVGISTCGQMHGPVGIGRNGEITTQWTQIWCDKRGESVCSKIKAKNNENDMANITGNPITSGWPGVKVRWIKDHEPEVYEKTYKFLVPKDFINYQLTGISATDPSEASGTYLYDWRKDAYSEDMAEIMELDLSKFAPIKKSYDIIGHLKPSIAQKFGLNKNIPVFAGGGDFIVSLLGLGLSSAGTAVDMTGTSTLLVVQKDTPVIQPSVQNLKHVIDGWLPFTMLDCGGLSMKWCKDLLNSSPLHNQKEISYEQMISMAQKVPIGSEGLIFYPYFLGERREENIRARAGFYGLSLSHNLHHFSRAVMEGVALALNKDVIHFKSLGVDIKKIICTGGATRNKFLYKIKADVMQIPQILIEEPESSLRGNALLAGYGLGLIKDLSAIFTGEENQSSIQPNPSNREEYCRLQTRFNRMYDHLLGYYKEAKF